ncbi:cytochrome P450 [Geopyxis carbonaria]|nr:cytochrome P450 [Geopyxis carbonaria]
MAGGSLNLSLTSLNLYKIAQNNILVSVAFCGAVFIFWNLAIGVYRLYFHPLSKIPGPKLAAFTGWYETYYDVYKMGKFGFEIKRMHEKYGPIVRISPHEVHIDDPEFFHKFYSSKKLKKSPWFYKMAGTRDVSFAMEENDSHRQRQGVYKNLFSMRSIQAFEPRLMEKVETLSRIFQRNVQTMDPINLTHAYRGMTSETIKSYIGLAENPRLKDFSHAGKDLQNYSRVVVETSAVVRHFPPLGYFRLLPGWVVALFGEDFGLLKKHMDGLMLQVRLAYENNIKNEHSTIIHGIVGNERHSAVSLEAIHEEAMLLEAAGTDSTAQSLESGTFHILSDPEVARKLKQELRDAIPDPNKIPSLSELQKLKYLTACINESMRVACPGSGRLPRINDFAATDYNGWHIPRSTPISMDLWHQHYNEKIFPNPSKFIPERWLQPDSSKLVNYFFPFGVGLRMCVGPNLSIAEQYLTMATVFRRFDLRIHDTTAEDIRMASSLIISLPSKESRGVSVTVVAEDEQLLRSETEKH